MYSVILLAHVDMCVWGAEIGKKHTKMNGYPTLPTACDRAEELKEFRAKC